MKRTLLGTSLLATLLVAGSFYAGQDPAIANAAAPDSNVELGGTGFRLLRLAVPADGRIGDILRKNATISGGFEVMDRRSIPAALIKATNFDKKGWQDIGSESVILADEISGQFKFRLYDLGSGDKPVLSRGYAANDPLKAANRFMNDVIEHYTKTPGVFGSRIAFVRTNRNPTVTKNVYSVEMNGEAPSAVTNNRSLNVLPSIGPGVREGRAPLRYGPVATAFSRPPCPRIPTGPERPAKTRIGTIEGTRIRGGPTLLPSWRGCQTYPARWRSTKYFIVW